MLRRLALVSMLSLSLCSQVFAQTGGTGNGQTAPLTPVAPAAATAVKGWLFGLQYNSTQPTFTNGQQGSAQATSRGALIVNPGTEAFNVTCQSGCAAGTASNASDGVATASTLGQTQAYAYWFNGATFDRARGDATNGAWVNVKASALPAGASTAANQATANTSLSSIDGKTPSLGSAAKASSVPVVLPTDPDSRPSSVNITVVDSGSSSASGQNSVGVVTGSPTTNSAATFAINGQSTGRLQVTGSWTGTLTFEGSIDGGTTYVSQPARVTGTVYTQGNITGNGQFDLDASGLTHLRVRATQAVVGTAVVQAVFSGTSGPVQVLNPVRIVDNSSGAQATVKAASTAPQASDPAIVVAISPNTVMPTTPVTGAFWQATQPISAASLPLPSGAMQQTGGTVGLTTQGYTASASITRTNDTNAYLANDIIGSATGSTAGVTFSSIGASGGDIVITSVEMEIDASATISGETSYNLYLYNVTPPSALGDNAAFDIPSGDRASFVGKVALGAPVDEGSTLYIRTDGVNAHVKLSGANLFGYLVTVGAYTPTASRVYKVTLHAAGL